MLKSLTIKWVEKKENKTENNNLNNYLNMSLINFYKRGLEKAKEIASELDNN